MTFRVSKTLLPTDHSGSLTSSLLAYILKISNYQWQHWNRPQKLGHLTTPICTISQLWMSMHIHYHWWRHDVVPLHHRGRHAWHPFQPPSIHQELFKKHLYMIDGVITYKKGLTYPQLWDGIAYQHSIQLTRAHPPFPQEPKHIFWPGSHLTYNLLGATAATAIEYLLA